MTDVVVDSAGTLGIEGQTAAPETIVAAREIGIDLRPHRSKGLCEEDVRGADLVLAMAREHVEEIGRLCPDVRCHLLRAFEHGTEPRDDAPDVYDPICDPVDVHRKCLVTIERCIGNVLGFVRQGRRAPAIEP
jgi:protein-tyrosine-phosphatase